jgi:hypothetical protein
MYYEFQTEIGRFTIRPDPGDPTRVLLSIDDIAVGKFVSAEAAARAVYSQQTGWERWDLLQAVEGPRDLSEWKGS